MQSDLLPQIDTGATFSPCREYRYILWREWERGPGIMFICLNPSTADEVVNDPTVERCERRARSMGYGRLVVCNLFAYRQTDRKVMLQHESPTGPDNDLAIIEEAVKAAKVVCAWGNDGQHLNRSEKVVKMLQEKGVKLHYLEMNSTGEPKHPLYVGYRHLPKVWLPG